MSITLRGDDDLIPLQQEKHVMQTVNFPFIMRFFRSFKDDAYIYFLLEFIQG